MGNGCVQHVWFAQNGALIVRLTRDMHKRAIIARIIYALEKTIYGLKKTIYGLERLFTAQKRLFTAWDYFCRIVSLFLITWRTFNQSMNKNIWMPYIKGIIARNCWVSAYSQSYCVKCKLMTLTTIHINAAYHSVYTPPRSCVFMWVCTLVLRLHVRQYLRIHELISINTNLMWVLTRMSYIWDIIPFIGLKVRSY